MEIKPSAELQKKQEQAKNALIQAGKDARTQAEQTGTPLMCVSAPMQEEKHQLPV